MPDWIDTFQNRARNDCSKRGQHCIDTTRKGSPWAIYRWGDLSPPPYGVFKNELYKRHDFSVECRRGYKYEKNQHLEISQIYVNGKCPYPRAKMNGKFPTPRAQKTGKSSTLSRGGDPRRFT